MPTPAVDSPMAVDLSVAGRASVRPNEAIPWLPAVVAALLSLLVVALTLAFAGGRHSSVMPAGRAGEVARSQHVWRVGSLQGTSLARLQQQSRIQATVRKRWLESAEARAQRVASRMAFHDLSGVGAQRLLTRSYGSVLAGASASPSASVARAGRLVRYEGDYRALVRGAHGLLVVRSTTPLLVGGVGGKRPLDLGLRADGGGFVPTASLAGVSIARNSASGVTVGGSGLRMTLESSDVAGRPVGGHSVFFPGVGDDMDAAVAPTIDGAEFFALLRSRLSPEVLRYRLSLPAGAVLRADREGAVVLRAGKVLAHILQPSARDDQGSAVAVSMRVVGDELFLRVAHRSMDVAYPVLVDPRVIMDLTESAEGWMLEADPGASKPTATAPPSLSLTASAGKSEWGAWKFYVPANLKSPVFFEFFGMTGEIHGTGGVGSKYRLEACNVSQEADAMEQEDNEIPSETGLAPSNCSTEHYIRVLVSTDGEPYYGAKLAVGSIVVAYEATEKEAAEVNFKQWGEESEGAPKDKQCFTSDPVNCATGNLVETQSDLSVGGRGPGLKLTRTYNSQSAAVMGNASTHGPFGYGWTGPGSAHLTFPETCWGREKCEKYGADVYEEDGGGVYFSGKSGGPYTPAALVQAMLVKEGSEYVYTLPSRSKLKFNSSGQLIGRTDSNGNEVTFARNSEGNIETITDGAGRKLTFKYNAEKEVESVSDPMGHVVKYTYEGGNLKSVSQPGETSSRWQFKYNSEHEMTEMVDGRGHAITTEYEKGRAVEQKDALGRESKWHYGGTESEPETEITEPSGSATTEKFNVFGLPTSITHAVGKSIAASTTKEYNSVGELIAVTDPNKHKTEYGYDAAGDLTSEKNADGDEKKWEYDSTHDIETKTTPDGETTTIKRNSAGDPEVIERPAPGSKTQKTTYKYDADGDVESMTNPLERTWKYEYDSYGDRKAETDPEGNKRTWEYNEDSQEIAEVSPRGNASGAKASEFTTKTERDAQGRPLKITDPLGHTTKYTYDGNGNVETVIDGNSHTTKYTYDADNELTKTEEPNKTITETEYDSMGQVKSQTDGNKHVTEYVRNALEEIEEVVSPLGKKTLKEYDEAGNLVKLTDPEKRTTTYTYDPANRLTEISYSSGKPATIKCEYNKDGDRTKVTDGTGTTKYEYDQLDRMTESENGHKEIVKYEYNLGNQQTKITYPNTKATERAYDKDGRLEKVTDWSSNVTKFTYNHDSELEKTIFPTASKDEDTYAYNDADQMSEVKMDKSTEVLASLVYTRDNDGQVKKTTSKGLPGAEVTENIYDENNRLTKYGGTEYKYDAANNPTTEGLSTNTYNEGDELEKGTGVKYTYDELGERTKTAPEKGPTTTYGYDQAGNLTSAERPKEGETKEIKDTYAYNGEDLRVSQTISGTTTYMAWDAAEELPLLLSEGTNSYIYGSGGLPVEQISSGGTVTYLHHDQQGSTRLLTGSTGAITGKCTYGAYGASTCEGTTTIPLGYDGQYTSSDTGLIYLRARVYDPSTAQFLTVDPLLATTRAPYTYATDNPLTKTDPTGQMADLPLVPLASTSCEAPKHTENDEREKRERLKIVYKEKEQTEREIAEERGTVVGEEASPLEDLVGKAVKVIGGCLAGSDAGTVGGGSVGAVVGGPAGAVVGIAVGGPVGCAAGGLGTALAPVNPLQPSEGGP
jgi:RHS repeat-associated protein